MSKVIGYEIFATITMEKELSDKQSDELLEKLDDLLKEYGLPSAVLSPLKENSEK